MKFHTLLPLILTGLSSWAVPVALPAEPPVFTASPRGVSVLAGSSVTLRGAASSAAPITYQWLHDAALVANASSPSLTLPLTQKSDEGDYQLIASNDSGSSTSAVARVTVVTADIPTITDALVAHYTFEQNANDTSGHGNAGANVGNRLWTPTGRAGGAALEALTKSDGSEFDYVTLGTADDLNFGPGIDFSVCLWVRYTNGVGEFPLVANRDWSAPDSPGWGIAVGPDGSVRWTFAGLFDTPVTYVGDAATVKDGAWHHVAVSFQRSSNALTYVDGVLVDTRALVAGDNDVATQSGLALNVGQDGTGAFTGGGTAGIDAGIDELAFWRRIITPQEIAWIYAKGLRGVNVRESVFNLAGGQSTRVTGQWDFDQGDLRPTVGQALEFGDGPGGPMEQHTTFGTTTSFGISDINFEEAHVMKYERNENPPDNYVAGYTMHHNILPNGGGTRVNRWTLIADMLIPDFSQGDQYTAVIEIQNDPASDADISIHQVAPGIAGIGISGQYPGNITQGEWHRIVVAVDMSGDAPVIGKYMDGVKVADQTTASGIGLDGRFTMSDVAHLFSDGEHDNEVNTFFVNSVQIRDGTLSEAEVAVLGGATASGIPLPKLVTGQWDFDQGDLRASIGAALEYGDGPGGPMEMQTSFGTTTSFGIPDIGSEVARVMKYTRNEAPPLNYVAGYTMHHGISPNGGGTRVNRWTLIADMFFPDLSQGDQYTAIIEIQNDPNSDADISIHEESPGIGGIGISGQYPGNISTGAWHRIVVAVDLAAAIPVISKFVDGAKVADQTSASGLGFDQRFSLDSVAHLFSDGEHDNEVNTYFVNSVQMRDGKLSDSEVAALGGPQASGIPLPNRVTGQWDFDQGDLRSTIGEPLEFGDGPGGPMELHTSFGTTTSFGIPDIASKEAKIMKYTRNEAPPDNYVAGYTMRHDISPNGGGTRVNKWTLIADMFFPDLSQGDQYTAIIEIQNDPASDADISIHEESPGIGGIGISGQYPGNISTGAWHRIVVAVDLAGAIPVLSKFVDGAKVADQTSASGLGLDLRFSLDSVAHLFSDGEHDNEVNTYYVNSVQIRDGKLSDVEVAALGGPQASGIPTVIPTGPGSGGSPKLVFQRAGNLLILTWDTSAAGFTLEGTPSLTSPQWSAVPGVVNNSIILSAESGTQFFRLHH